MGNITFDGGPSIAPTHPRRTPSRLSSGTLNVPPNTTITGTDHRQRLHAGRPGYGQRRRFQQQLPGVHRALVSHQPCDDLRAHNYQRVRHDRTRGGISVGYQGTLTLLNSSIVGNYGGGISNFYGTALTVSNCNISGNSAGVGIVNESGTLTVNSTTVSGNADIGILIGGDGDGNRQHNHRERERHHRLQRRRRQ